MVRIDCKGNVVLAEFEKCAVIARMGNCVEPFVVAHWYDFETGSWSRGDYFSDLADAWNMADPDVCFNLSRSVRLSEVSQMMSEAGYKVRDSDDVKYVSEHLSRVLVPFKSYPHGESVKGVGEECEILEMRRLDDTCSNCYEFFECPDSREGMGLCRRTLEWFRSDSKACDDDFCRRPSAG